FGNDEVESSWGFVPSRNEERSRWLAWVMPVPGVLRILRLSSDDQTLEMPELKLPPGCRLFAFLNRLKSAPLLVLLHDEGITGVSLEEATFGEQRTLLQKEDLRGARFPDLGLPAWVDWNMDIDQDGYDDLIVFARKNLNVYRQSREGDLVFSDQLDDLDSSVGQADCWPETQAGIPVPAFSNPEMWLEPSLNTDLPTLVLGSWDRHLFWEQASPGVFSACKVSEINEDGIASRTVVRCRLNSNGPEGLATCETYWSQGWPESRTAWISHGKTVPPLTVKRSVLPINPVDIDHDGAVEFLMADIPPVTKALSVLAQGMLKNLTIKCSFVRWSERNSCWVQASRAISMKPPETEGAGMFHLFWHLSEVSLVGEDLNGDGVGDVAWLAGDSCVEVRLLNANDGVIDVLASHRVNVGSGIESLKAVDTDRDGVCEILAVRDLKRGNRQGDNQGMREYQLVYYQK
ncbi:MAG: VCBS repeat-containing protein, partial [Candidatus Hydrogenedentes bacterium]|nr:VCBS repeat-containing protein [Candidatus Hydrogenedentota bacterium]